MFGKVRKRFKLTLHARVFNEKTRLHDPEAGFDIFISCYLWLITLRAISHQSFHR